MTYIPYKSWKDIFQKLDRKFYTRFKHQTRRMFAKVWLNILHKNVTQIAITGSFGKTTITHAIHSILSTSYTCIKTDTNLDSRYNVPLTILKLRNEKIIVFELGIDRLGEMDFHLDLVKPQISIISGIEAVHSDDQHLGSIKNIILEKRRIIEVLGKNDFAILNYEDKNIQGMRSFTKANIIWYGMNPKCDIFATDITSSKDGIMFNVSGVNSNFEITCGLLGRHNVHNLLAAIAVGEILGVHPDKIKMAIEGLKPLKGRLNIENGPLNTILVDDSLRSNPTSLHAGLSFIKNLKTINRKIAIIGEMGELGEMAVIKHQEIGDFIATIDLDLLVCIGQLTEHITNRVLEIKAESDRVYNFRSPQEAFTLLRDFILPGDLIYLKGSRLRHMERILMLLNNELVGCKIISCHFYHSCNECKYRYSGYSNE